MNNCVKRETLQYNGETNVYLQVEMQMNIPLVFKYYFNKQMTYFSVAVY